MYFLKGQLLPAYRTPDPNDPPAFLIFDHDKAAYKSAVQNRTFLCALFPPFEKVEYYHCGKIGIKKCEPGCGAALYEHEAKGSPPYSFCCQRGKVKRPEFGYPQELRELFEGDTPEKRKERAKGRFYNSRVSLGSGKYNKAAIPGELYLSHLFTLKFSMIKLCRKVIKFYSLKFIRFFHRPRTTSHASSGISHVHDGARGSTSPKSSPFKQREPS
jgi:hypothetical protein